MLIFYSNCTCHKTFFKLLLDKDSPKRFSIVSFFFLNRIHLGHYPRSWNIFVKIFNIFKIFPSYDTPWSEWGADSMTKHESLKEHSLKCKQPLLKKLLSLLIGNNINLRNIFNFSNTIGSHVSTIIKFPPPAPFPLPGWWLRRYDERLGASLVALSVVVARGPRP